MHATTLSKDNKSRPENFATTCPRTPKLHNNALRRGASLSVAAPESETDMGLHPEPWHGKENHSDVLKRKAAPTGVAAVGAIAQSFRSASHPCHHEVSRTTATSTSLQIQIWASPLPRVSPSHPPLHPSPPSGPRGIATTATMVPAREPCRLPSRGRRPGIHVPRHRQPSASQRTNHGRKSGRQSFHSKTGISHRVWVSASIVGSTHACVPSQSRWTQGGHNPAVAADGHRRPSPGPSPLAMA